jgi:hypothetical protein
MMAELEAKMAFQHKKFFGNNESHQETIKACLGKEWSIRKSLEAAVKTGSLED